MSKLRLIVVLAVVAVQVAFAQPASPLRGNWAGSMPGLTGNQLGVELSLGETSGTFRMKPPAGSSGRNNQCFGKEFPVVVSSMSSSEATIEIGGSKVLPGCLDQTVTIKSIDGKTIEGTMKDGRVFKLDRQ